MTAARGGGDSLTGMRRRAPTFAVLGPQVVQQVGEDAIQGIALNHQVVNRESRRVPGAPVGIRRRGTSALRNILALNLDC